MLKTRITPPPLIITVARGIRSYVIDPYATRVVTVGHTREIEQCPGYLYVRVFFLFFFLSEPEIVLSTPMTMRKKLN